MNLLLSTLVALHSFASTSPNGGGTLWYDKPAASWTEALPVGNGSLGGMIFGGTDKERIQFNEQTLWPGDEIQMGNYQPFGDLSIDSPDLANASGYRREFDLSEAIHRTTFTSNGVKFTREVLSSHPDQVMIIRLTADKPGAVSGTIRLTDMHNAVISAAGDTLNPTLTPDLAKSAIVSLNARGDGGTGWSKAWKINFWARLTNGNRAHSILNDLLNPVGTGKLGGRYRGGVYPNLFDGHPPFQIDRNFGATAGITEMLLQSHVRKDCIYLIDLLPALPDAWNDGTINGLRARGAFNVDLAWRNGKLAKTIITSAKGGKTHIRANGRIQTITLPANGRHEIH